MIETSKPKQMLRYLILFFLSITLFSQEPYTGLNLSVDGPGNGDGRGVIIVEDGYIIDTGHACYGGISCLGLVKVDFSGEIQWTQSYTSNPFTLSAATNSFFQDQDGSLLIPGVEYSTETALDYFLMKLDENGDSLWKKTYTLLPNVFQDDILNRAGLTINNEYILSGTVDINDDLENIYLVKTDKEGNILWEKTHTYQDYTFYDVLNVAVDTDGGFIISGSIEKDTILSSGNRRFIDISFIMKTDSEGEFLWAKTYGYPLPYDNFWVRQTKVIPDGSGYIMTSAVPRDTVNYDWDSQEIKEFYVARLDTEGEIVWQRNFPSDNWKYINDLLLTKDGNYVMGVGHNRDHNLEIVGNYSTGWMFKIDIETGELLWERDYVSLEHLFVPIFDLNSIEETDNGTLVATGEVRDTIPDSDLHFGMAWLLTLDLDGCPEAGTCEDTDSVVYLNLQEVTDNFYMSSGTSPLQIYPNPTQDHLTIEYPAQKNKPLHCKLYDGIGRLVHEQKIEKSPTTIRVNTLKLGIYLCQIQDENGTLHSEKILIQR